MKIMDRKDLYITVGGIAGSGKSRLLYQLKMFLKEKGYDVEQENSMDFNTIDDFDLKMSADQPQVTDMLKTKKIHIKDMYLNREIVNIKPYNELDPYGEENWED